MKIPDNEKWLDFGCGEKKIPGCLGVDFINLPNADIIHDLNDMPYPFDDNSFDHIICNHILEHLDNVLLTLNEIHRIAKPNAIIEICVPHYASDNFNTDVTHKTHFSSRSMNYFIINSNFEWNFYTNKKFKLIYSRISFRQNKTDYREKIKFNPFKIIGLESLINIFPRIYERFFVYWLPPSELYWKLMVIK